MSVYRPYDTYTTSCGGGRAEFRPDLSKIRPWAIFLNGEHVTSLETRLDCAKWFSSKKYRLNRVRGAVLGVTS